MKVSNYQESVIPGDLVTLRHGGPEMTVTGITAPRNAPHLSLIQCEWSDGNETCSGMYPVSQLVLIPSPVGAKESFF